MMSTPTNLTLITEDDGSVRIKGDDTDVKKTLIIIGDYLLNENGMTQEKLDTLVDDNSCRHYALHFLGQDKEAEEWMDKIIALDPQDAGNFLAGAIKRQSGIFAPIIQLGYGAYNISKNNKPILGLIAMGTLCLFVQNPSLGITASIYLMNGEETLSQLSIDKGYNYVK